MTFYFYFNFQKIFRCNNIYRLKWILISHLTIFVVDRNSEQTENFLPVKVEPGLDSLNKNPDDFTCMPEEDNTPPDRYSKYSRIVEFGHSEISNKLREVFWSPLKNS